MMHWNEALVVALVATSGVLLLATVIAWQRLISGSPSLPIWRFLRRQGITRDDTAHTLSGKAVMQAELSCTLCGSRRQCLERLDAGAAAPLAYCPNARLFDEFGLRVDQTRA